MHPRSAHAKAVPNVRQQHPAVRDMARALSRASKLLCAPRAAAHSTLIPGTDPARLKPTACASPRPNCLPTATIAHKTRRAASQPIGPHRAGATSPSTTCARSARFYPARVVRDGSCAARRVDHHQDVRSLSNACPKALVVLGLRSTAPGQSWA